MRLSKHSAGVTLLEVLVSMGLLSIIAISMSQFFGSTSKSQRRARIKTVYEYIGRDLDNKIRSSNTIYLSLLSPLSDTIGTPNSELIQCVLGSGTGCTTDLQTYNPAKKNFFTLVYPKTQNLAGAAAGTDRRPIFYDTQGLPEDMPNSYCKNHNDVNCVFQAKAFFYATCPDSPSCTSGVITCENLDTHPSCSSGSRAPTCSNGAPAKCIDLTGNEVGPPVCQSTSTPCTLGAAQVHIAYEVSQFKHFANLGSDFKALPHSAALTTDAAKPRFFTHQIKDVLGSENSTSCNPGAIIIGFNSNGTPKCKCSLPYVQRSVFPLTNQRGEICRMTLADDLTCPDGEVFRGLNPDGTAHCLPLDQAYECKTISSPRPWQPVGSQVFGAISCSSPGDSELGAGGSIPPDDPNGVSYWVQNDYRVDCKFWCTMPQVDWAECQSDEAHEDRYQTQYRKYADPKCQSGQWDVDVYRTCNSFNLFGWCIGGWTYDSSRDTLSCDGYSELRRDQAKRYQAQGISLNTDGSDNRLQPGLNSYDFTDRRVYPSSLSKDGVVGAIGSNPLGLFRTGLICKKRVLTCCRPKGQY